ncbi:MAG: PAS domain-containing protein [Magnetococcales bacterium]|nr:PAS domain-containing protein [Magnetococcales bacterium]
MSNNSESIGAKKLQMADIFFHEVEDGIIITTSEGSVVDLNPAFSKIIGYSREEVVGKVPDFLKSDSQNMIYYNDILKTISIKGRWAGVLKVKTKSGEDLAGRLTIVAVKNHDKQTTNYIGFLRLADVQV